MDNRIKDFLTSLNGKKIALIGIGRSNLPLISLLTQWFFSCMFSFHVFVCFPFLFL